MSEQFYLSTNGAELFCRRYGRGEPVIMIHGACVDSDFFHETAQVLSRTFTVHTYDRRGYGRSKNSDDHSISIQVEDAAALIRQAGSPCHVIAHSGGTVIAMELAAKYPTLVRKLLLHEPLDAAFLDLNSEASQTLAAVSRSVREGKYNKAISQFMPLIGERDPRARAATDEELRNMGKNCRCFAAYEFEALFSYSTDADALHGRSITVGVGERSRDSHRWVAAAGLAEKLGAKLLYFPGGHNCAYDLPEEFGYLAAGAMRE